MISHCVNRKRTKFKRGKSHKTDRIITAKMHVATGIQSTDIMINIMNDRQAVGNEICKSTLL